MPASAISRSIFLARYSRGRAEGVDGFDEEIVYCGGIDETDGRVSEEDEWR